MQQLNDSIERALGRGVPEDKIATEVLKAAFAVESLGNRHERRRQAALRRNPKGAIWRRAARVATESK